MYWYPLYAFARRQGLAPEDARDVTQEFFAQLVASGGVSTATPERGRFRNFLLKSFRNLLTYMLEDARNISSAIRLTFIGKYFERMADGATNICEMVVYLVEGKMIKHTAHAAAAGE